MIWRPSTDNFALALCVTFLGASSGTGCGQSCTTDYKTQALEIRGAGYPKIANPQLTRLELCVDDACFVTNFGGVAGRFTSVDSDKAIDARCVFADDQRSFTLTLNTAYIGHPGSDRIYVNALAPNDARTPLLTGRVLYEDTSGSGDTACGGYWRGRFYADP